MLKKTLVAVAVAGIATLVTACGGSGSDADLAFPASADIFTTDGTTLHSFNSQSRLMASSAAITGLTAGTSLVGLDFNPNGGALVGLGSNGQVYSINTGSAVATPVGTPNTVTSLANKAVDIDFNPRVQNVFRIVTSTLDNYRTNATTGARPNTGASCNPADCGFKYATADANAGKTIAVVGAGYTNSRLNGGTIPASTVVFVIDAANDVLARLGGSPASGTVGDGANPNEGILNTVGPLGVDAEGFVGFDIDSGNTGYAAVKVGGDYRLFTVNTGSGALIDNGIIPPAVGEIRGFAIQQQ